MIKKRSLVSQNSFSKRQNRTGNKIISLLLSFAVLFSTYTPGISQKGTKATDWSMRKNHAAKFEKTNEELKTTSFDMSVLYSAGTQNNAAVIKTTPYIAYNAEFKDEASQKKFNVAGATIFNRYKNFADFYVKNDGKGQTVLNNVANSDGLIWFEYIGQAEAPPPPRFTRGRKSKGEGEQIVRGGINNLTGKGVIIAIVDTGVDFRNPDFIKYDANGLPTSRILYMWDTTSDAFDRQKLGTKPPVSYPNGASVGTVFTQKQLTDDLRAKVKRIGATDMQGHGTACASVAAGNGNNDRERNEVIGVAPDADIIAVRISSGKVGGLENAYLLNSIAAWVDKIADEKKQPLVVSCSFGGQYGAHDGKRVSERQLNARFSPDRVGRTLAIAAGNEGSDPIHAVVTFKGEDNPGRVLFNGGSFGAQISIYYDTDDLADLGIAPAGATRIIGNPGGDVNAISKQASGTVRVGAGAGGLYLYNRSGREMTAHLYISGKANPTTREEPRFTRDSVNFGYLVGTPGTAANALTVGSYDWNDMFKSTATGYTPWEGAFCRIETATGFVRPPIQIGNISCYSSIGYSRDGTVKPDIAAPGEIYHASYAKDQKGVGVYPPNKARYVDSTGNYILFNGTSAATPYVSGIVALMFEKKKTLTLGEVKKLLQENATQNALTEATPNAKWGYGKLDMDAVKRVLDEVK